MTAISRGLSGAISPVWFRKATRIPEGCQPLSILASLRDAKAIHQPTGGIAALNPRLMASIPSGSIARRGGHVSGNSLVEFWEFHFQPFHSVPPFRSGGFANGIRNAEETDFMNRLFQRHSLQPSDWYEVLALIRIIEELSVVFATFGDIENRNVARWR